MTRRKFPPPLKRYNHNTVKKEQWERLPYGYFNAGEPWGDASIVEFELVYLLDRLRHDLKTPIFVTYGTQGAHQAPWHRQGLAVDACIDITKIHPLDVILNATRYPFGGFGVLPLAVHPRCTRALGVHFDIRPQKNRRQSRWIWVNWKQYPLDEVHLNRFGLII